MNYHILLIPIFVNPKSREETCYMINTNYSERYMSTYTSRINSNDVAKTSDNDFANAVGKAEGDANA